MNTFNAVELFAGAGGLSTGLEMAGFSVLLANEIEKDFAGTLKDNHPKTQVITGDIHEIDFRKAAHSIQLTKLDLLSGGPPCQGFSTVGSKNKMDPRNSLFYEYLRAVSELKPKYVLFENVSGFFRLYQGIAYKTLLKELTDLGYEYCSGIVDAANYGLPQRRSRTIIIGWQKGLKPVDLPEITHTATESLFCNNPWNSLIDAISDLPPLSPGEEKDYYLSPPANHYQKKLRQELDTLSEHNASQYGERMQEILGLIPPGGTVEDLPLHLRPKGYFKNTYARLLPNQPAPTITRNFGTPSSSRCVHPFQNRALSTREGARLQGFPDNYRFRGSKISKNLQIGNAVPPILGESIGKSIYAALSA
jgi:DNA (cytosine-5)-methyltransferase 1